MKRFIDQRKLQREDSFMDQRQWHTGQLGAESTRNSSFEG
ncbi:hypothetical protein NC653_023570 [Populus alba x Populus x berolinensis]|uniref:Uncharacterized protein n=1 Tax=Populus alba x Populus x berolinensis TaxID=444605 RepID=A0AAD6MHS8_9ROSI|nr:hypothetical protein NC653_023570 [Populus alba x Populus x berolinensis]